MLKPVCVKCQRFFRVKKGGYYFTEGMPHGDKAQPGTIEPEKWLPYKIWVGDLYECQGCGTQIVSGFGQQPVAEHYQDGFEHTAKVLRADQLQVNDC